MHTGRKYVLALQTDSWVFAQVFSLRGFQFTDAETEMTLKPVTFTLVDPEELYVVDHSEEPTRGTNVQVVFNEDLVESTINADNITISGTRSGDHVCSLSFDHVAKLLDMDPQSDFAYGELVTVRIDTGIQDVTGTYLSEPYEYSFKIQDAPPVLGVTPGQQTVGATSGTTTFVVSNEGGGAMAWTARVITGESWLEIADGMGNVDDGTITVAYQSNETAATRTGTIRISAPGTGVGYGDIHITQYFTDRDLSLDLLTVSRRWIEPTQSTTITANVSNDESVDEIGAQVVLEVKGPDGSTHSEVNAPSPKGEGFVFSAKAEGSG